MITENMTVNACALFTTIIKNTEPREHIVSQSPVLVEFSTASASENIFIPARSRSGIITGMLNVLKKEGYEVGKDANGKRCFIVPLEKAKELKYNFKDLSENPEDWTDEPEIEEEEEEIVVKETNVATVAEGGEVILVDDIELPEE